MFDRYFFDKNGNFWEKLALKLLFLYKRDVRLLDFFYFFCWDVALQRLNKKNKKSLTSKV